MEHREKVFEILNESCGNCKDNIVALSTISAREDGSILPFVREVDALYEDGIFYITTWAKSNKMRQIEKNYNVAFSVNLEGITGHGIAENLGWVLEADNANIRTKLREAFSNWYDEANNEKDENCIILSVKIRQCEIVKDHGAIRYSLNLDEA